eukprot:CAMPEP_0201517580 /NCGR_PEP_ID=MMETSP0161_2-20130828/8653_1 /ASSEMBLY_ACC=CAM_ASM_000251 /TAXON_ID=180227 /ORGANISM="Neoparamoeba aestuarina, Strain SoJaBio B1-5/56/2" /LENGTH=194 /DNA_ID=CAMNT_0047915127 /DNA_START=53 /DNA_END=634 /DNA_ORIENTATION=-
MAGNEINFFVVTKHPELHHREHFIVIHNLSTRMTVLSISYDGPNTLRHTCIVEGLIDANDVKFKQENLETQIDYENLSGKVLCLWIYSNTSDYERFEHEEDYKVFKTVEGGKVECVSSIAKRDESEAWTGSEEVMVETIKTGLSALFGKEFDGPLKNWDCYHNHDGWGEEWENLWKLPRTEIEAGKEEGGEIKG